VMPSTAESGPSLGSETSTSAQPFPCCSLIRTLRHIHKNTMDTGYFDCHRFPAGERQFLIDCRKRHTDNFLRL
jgi:hypothetical protein